MTLHCGSSQKIILRESPIIEVGQRLFDGWDAMFYGKDGNGETVTDDALIGEFFAALNVLGDVKLMWDGVSAFAKSGFTYDKLVSDMATFRLDTRREGSK